MMVSPTSREDVLGWLQATFELWKLAGFSTPAERYLVQANALTFLATSFGDVLAYPIGGTGTPAQVQRLLDLRFMVMAYSINTAGAMLARECGACDAKEFERVREHVAGSAPDYLHVIDANAEQIVTHSVAVAERLHPSDPRRYAGVMLAIVGSVVEMAWHDILQKRKSIPVRVLDASALIQTFDKKGGTDAATVH